MSERPGGGGGGTSPNFRSGGSARDKKWTQSDLKFSKNEGSIRSKTNEKGVNSIENWCEMEKIDAKSLKLV